MAPVDVLRSGACPRCTSRPPCICRSVEREARIDRHTLAPSFGCQHLCQLRTRGRDGLQQGPGLVYAASPTLSALSVSPADLEDHAIANRLDRVDPGHLDAIAV